jgi:hypothetical protein
MIGRTRAALEKIRRTHHCLIVAVTGSIACGKTTVSGMLEELGAPLIDMDQIAREVVMLPDPGTTQEYSWSARIMREVFSMGRSCYLNMSI